MRHIHSVIDSDAKYFTINPITRVITNETPKTILIKGDHNSERFTFEIPRYVEGHDMSTSTKIEVHYINISSKNRDKSVGVYEVNDAKVITEDNKDYVTFTWLISGNVTKYTGSLSFAIRFACLTADIVDYSWNTAINTGITISDGIDNGQAVFDDISDILQTWYDKFLDLSDDLYAVTDEGVILNLTEKLRTEESERKTTDADLLEKINAIDYSSVAAQIKAGDDKLYNDGVLKAVKAITDSEGNNIAETYLPKDRAFKNVFLSVSDLGLTAPVTIVELLNEIITKDINNSVIMISNSGDGSDQVSDTPYGYGCLLINVPNSVLRMSVQFTTNIGSSGSTKAYIANYIRADGTNTVIDVNWNELVTSSTGKAKDAEHADEADHATSAGTAQTAVKATSAGIIMSTSEIYGWQKLDPIDYVVSMSYTDSSGTEKTERGGIKVVDLSNVTGLFECSIYMDDGFTGHNSYHNFMLSIPYCIVDNSANMYTIIGKYKDTGYAIQGLPEGTSGTLALCVDKLSGSINSKYAYLVVYENQNRIYGHLDLLNGMWIRKIAE